MRLTHRVRAGIGALGLALPLLGCTAGGGPEDVVGGAVRSEVPSAAPAPAASTAATSPVESRSAAVPVALGPPVQGAGFTVAFPQGWVVVGDEASTTVPGGTARLRVTSEPGEDARIVAAGVQLDALGALAATDYELEGEGPVEVPDGGAEIRYAAVLPDGRPLRFRTVALAREGLGVAVTLSAPPDALDGLVAAQDAVLSSLELQPGG